MGFFFLLLFNFPVRCIENTPSHRAPSLLYFLVNAVVHETDKVIRLLLIDFEQQHEHE